MNNPVQDEPYEVINQRPVEDGSVEITLECGHKRIVPSPPGGHRIRSAGCPVCVKGD